MSEHIGFAGRKKERFRFSQNDPQEITLQMSAECAEQIMYAIQLMSDVARTKISKPLEDLEFALRALDL